MYLPAEIIKKKRNGNTLTKSELEYFVNEYTKEKIPDYQMAALLMAIFFQGMSEKETLVFTECMRDSGSKLKFDKTKKFAVDKHSTGGIGDKTSIILAPLVACAGLSVPMISGRGLGHTGGTVDKLESIPGFNPFVNEEKCYAMIDKIGVSMMAQTENICPADKKIYALRDVTATVESLPLICASIMSKKLAEGIHGLVLDVKFGSGAFMKTIEKAKELAKGLMGIGIEADVNIAAYLTNMNQPLGRFVGHSLEIQECIAIMKDEPFGNWKKDDFADTRELSLELAGTMLYLGKKASTPEAGYKVATEILRSGAAYEKFTALCEFQGGDINKIGVAKKKVTIKSPKQGFISNYDSEKIGIAAILIGAGRKISTDRIDLTAGIEVFKKIGDRVDRNEALFILHLNSDQTIGEVTEILLNAVDISDNNPGTSPLIAERLFR
ncbi:MAG: thymidine phosphorylase [Proteobacteria bacterium SG_bin7]|nr:MAG: thymidine phosphorylase [Proteobacteria bacterium SG_bin7]